MNCTEGILTEIKTFTCVYTQNTENGTIFLFSISIMLSKMFTGIAIEN